MEDIPPNNWYRLGEILPGAASWAILILPVALSPFLPKGVAIFMIFYVTLWFLRSLKFNFYLLYSWYKSRKFEKQDWEATLAHMGHRTIYHVVILATYKEPLNILEESVKSLTEATYPLEKIFFVLATEERDRENAEKNAEALKQKFGHQFGGFYHFMHPQNLPDEIRGKGSNIYHAGKEIAREMERKNIPPDQILVTTLDADNRVHPNYFSVLTYHYLITPDAKHKSFQPLPQFYNNIWEVPMLNRLVALSSTFWHLSQSAQISTLRNFSAHAQSLDALLETDFWSRQTICEDGHQFWRSYFAFKGDYRVVPIFIPVYQDAVQNKTYVSTLKGQYVQLRRWAWGVSDTPFVALKMWKMRRELPLWKSLVHFFQLMEGHIMWATAPIVITLTNSVPQMLNPQFAESVFAYNLGQILSTYFTIALVGIFISVWISMLSLPPHPAGWKWRLLSTVQWFFLPLSTIVFGAIPAIDAQTRLMLNRPLHFQVTEKMRKVEMPK